MTLRVALLTELSDQRVSALRNVLKDFSAGVDLRVMHRGGQDGVAARPSPPTRPNPRLPFGAFLALAAYRPHLTICEDFGRAALQAALYRSRWQQTRLLLCATEAPHKPGALDRWILNRADAVLAEGEAAAHAVEQLRFPSSRIFLAATPIESDAFLACERTRRDAEGRRLIFAGNLSPQSGAADLLICLAAWAEQNPSRQLEIWWAGEGDLAGVLDAQPLPPNVAQRFLGRLEPAALAAAFGQCGILVVPSLIDDRKAPVAEALAAGLLVLGSRLDRKVRQLVRDDVNGWTFDALQPADMARGLGRALDAPTARLEQMRDHAQALLRPSTVLSFTERFAGALAAIMPDGGPAALPQPAL